MLKETKEEIIAITKRWLETFIIGLNLCPFAKQPYQKGEVRFSVIDFEEPQDFVKAFAKEVELLESDSTIETTLIIIPAFGKMEHFKAYFEICENILKINNLTNTYMVVPFHPFLRHHGYSVNAPEQFTGISQYPMVHLLRKASVDKLGATAKTDIQIENNKKLKKIGRAKLLKMWGDMLREFA